MLTEYKKIIIKVTLFIILIAIISAYIVEIILGHKPCNLCLYERIPYAVGLILILQIIFLKKYEKISVFLIFFTFLISFFLASYHLGIEESFFNEPLTCKTNTNLDLTSKELLKGLNKSVISCKNVSFRIAGLSLAAINAFLSFLIAVIYIKLFLNYEKN